MNREVLNAIKSLKADVIIFDIDGTLKDLCNEHEAALRLTLIEYNVGATKSKFILRLNNIAMAMVKTGMFPTNHAKQSLLIWVFSVLAGIQSKSFRDKYYDFYKQQICLFDGIHDLLNELSVNKRVYFATINKQNYNLEECGIPQHQIVYTTGVFKVETYKSLLGKLNVSKQSVVIIGDNLFDDILSAKLLKVNSFLVNNYNSKLKKVFCKLLNDKHLK